MALLNDPTIQRILDEVNKAANGGILGNAGNYVSEPTETFIPFEGQLPESSTATSTINMNNFYQHDDLPMFYPTSDMFAMTGLIDFENKTDFNSILSSMPNMTTNDFDLYNSNLYDTMTSNFMYPYENYNQQISNFNEQQPRSNKNSMRSIASVSSTVLAHQQNSLASNNVPPSNITLQESTPTSSQQLDFDSNKISSTSESMLNNVEHLTMEQTSNKDEYNEVSSTTNDKINLTIDSEYLSKNLLIYLFIVSNEI